MKPGELVLAFADREIGPIDIYDDVMPIILEMENLEVYFWSVKMDTELLKGRIIDDSYPVDGEVQRAISIDYANSLSNELARLVCCKEIVHILDPLDERVTSEPAVNDLIEKLVLPPEMQSLDHDGTVWNDRYGYLYALAILFPWATRELFRPAYEANTISIEKIADYVELPVEFAAAVMNPRWQRIHHLITN